MKVLHINTYDRGGAANACLRLHLSLLEKGIESNLLILHKFNKKDIPNCFVYKNIEKKKSLIKRLLWKILPVLKKNETIKASIQKLIPETIEWFSFPDTGIDISTHPLYQDADIINLHWTANFLDYSFFEKNNKPIVWTLHDMNPFTGGCHYSFSCQKFQSNCSNCPQLQTIKEKDFSLDIFNYKKKYFLKEENVTVVCPSVWLEKQAKSSKLLANKKLFTIPYGIDSSVFKPHDKQFSRKLLGLPEDKRIILFLSYSSKSSNKRKGLDLLSKGLELLNDFTGNTVLCVVGGKMDLSQITFQHFQYSAIADEILMSVFYSACDVFILPSLEDNLPNTVLESQMCGTPVIGFPIGGMIDSIIDDENGYIAEEITSESLASTIRKFLSRPDNFDSNKIRKKALEKYDSPIQAEAYITIYKEALE